MKQLILLLIITVCTLTVGAQKTHALYYPEKKATTLKDFILEINKETQRYPEQRSRVLYVHNHPALKAITGIDFHGAHRPNIDLHIWNYFRDRGYLINMSSEQHDRERPMVQVFNGKFTHTAKSKYLRELLAKAGNPTLTYYTAPDMGISNASNYSMHKINAKPMVVYDSQKMHLRGGGYREAVLEEEFFETYSAIFFEKDMMKFRGKKFSSYGIAHPVTGRVQINALCGGLLSSSLDPSAYRAKQMISLGIIGHIQEWYSDRVRQKVEPGYGQYYFLNKGIMKCAARVDSDFRLSKVKEHVRLRIAHSDMNEVDIEKYVLSLLAEWSAEDYRKFGSYCNNELGRVLQYVENGPSYTSRILEARYWILGLVLVSVFLRIVWYHRARAQQLQASKKVSHNKKPKSKKRRVKK